MVVALSNTDTAPTPPEIKPKTPVNAIGVDIKAVVDRVIYHLNKARENIGSGEFEKLLCLTVYAEYRNSQLSANFAHDISNWYASIMVTPTDECGK